MKSRSRLFFKGILNHCYQRTIGGVLLFYSVSDYLVFFTIVCVLAKRYRIRILAMAPMPDHIHLSVIAEREQDFINFMHEYTRLFAAENNIICHRSGPLFQSPFGSAPKTSDKAARNNLIYVGNNARERHLCRQAESYRWSFLAYAVSTHPFSEPLIVRKASKALQRAVRVVRSEHAASRPLSYPLLQRLFSVLTRTEKEQLVDLIISTYNVIDYASSARFFDGYDNMITAMHASTGSEYGLNEVSIGKTDEHYSRMTSILMGRLQLNDIHDIFLLDEERRWELFILLRENTGALAEQIAKYLRIPLRKNSKYDIAP